MIDYSDNLSVICPCPIGVAFLLRISWWKVCCYYVRSCSINSFHGGRLESSTARFSIDILCWGGHRVAIFRWRLEHKKTKRFPAPTIYNRLPLELLSSSMISHFGLFLLIPPYRCALPKKVWITSNTNYSSDPVRSVLSSDFGRIGWTPYPFYWLFILGGSWMVFSLWADQV